MKKTIQEQFSATCAQEFNSKTVISLFNFWSNNHYCSNGDEKGECGTRAVLSIYIEELFDKLFPNCTNFSEKEIAEMAYVKLLSEVDFPVELTNQIGKSKYIQTHPVIIVRLLMIAKLFVLFTGGEKIPSNIFKEMKKQDLFNMRFDSQIPSAIVKLWNSTIILCTLRNLVSPLYVKANIVDVMKYSDKIAHEIIGIFYLEILKRISSNIEDNDIAVNMAKLFKSSCFKEAEIIRYANSVTDPGKKIAILAKLVEYLPVINDMDFAMLLVKAVEDKSVFDYIIEEKMHPASVVFYRLVKTEDVFGKYIFI